MNKPNPDDLETRWRQERERAEQERDERLRELEAKWAAHKAEPSPFERVAELLDEAASLEPNLDDIEISMYALFNPKAEAKS